MFANLVHALLTTLTNLVAQNVLFTLVILLWPLLLSVKVFLLRPMKIYKSHHSLWLGIIYSNLKFILHGPQLIQKAYREAKGSQFAIPALREYQVLVTSQEHLREINVAHPQQLSFEAAMEDRIRFFHTCNGFEVGPHSVDPLCSVPQKTLKMHLRKSLPAMMSRFDRSLINGLEASISRESSFPGWKTASIFNLSEEVCSRMNNQALFGENLASNPAFQKASVQYAHDVAIAMELARHTPEILVPTLISAVMYWSGARKKVIHLISQAVQERLKLWNAGDPDLPKDCVTWVIQSSTGPKQRTKERIVQQLLGLMFASAHQLPMALTYAIYDLCDHPEYIDDLREEAETTLSTNDADFTQYMPRLESFLRESARYNPLDALTVQRKAIADFHFSDGTSVPKGNLVAVAQQCVLNHPKYYPDPDIFDAWRFLRAPDSTASDTQGFTKFTDVSLVFPYWGAPKRTCAGRWYVSCAMKQILTHLLTTYDFKLANNKESRTFIWTTAIVPRRRPKILLRERNCQT